MCGAACHDEKPVALRASFSIPPGNSGGLRLLMGGILANNGMYYQPMVTGSVTALTAVRSNSGSSVSQLNALLAALRTALVVS